MNPGDTVRARTQTGMLIEVKIPAGAHPGDVVQFAVPDSWKENEDGMETPTLKAKKVGEEKINVQDVDHHGVTNAHPKMTFSISVPSDTKPGHTLVAELPDGERVAVTVPDGAKPGRELHFRVSDGPAGGSPVEVLMRGFLKKKSPKGLRGMHAWQMRWFELNAKELRYWEVSMEGVVNLRGNVSLAELLVGVRVHHTDGERIDLLLKSGRMFQLCAPSRVERDDWGKQLQQVLVDTQVQQLQAANPDVVEAVPGAAVAEDEEGPTRISQADNPAINDGAASPNPAQRQLLAQMTKLAVSPTKATTLEPGAAPIAGAVYVSRVARARVANATKRAAEAGSADGMVEAVQITEVSVEPARPT